MDIRIVGALTGYGAAVLAIPALLLWPGLISVVFLIVAVSLLSVSLTLWAVHKEWIR